jgi:homoserine dehydrogenase
MSSRKQLTIGLFGFGTVGKGLYDALKLSSGLQVKIKKIAVKDHDKPRALPASYFTYDHNELLNDPEINVIVELIDDSEAAYTIVKAAMKSGKAVVTANKKLVAERLEELIALQQQYDVPLLYEAACCASLPVIRNLEEYYDNDLLQSVQGIVNGSTNYILTKIFAEGLSYSTALKEAQEKGFAESDPRLDVEGFDAKYKLVLLLLHAFGIKAHPDQIWNLGIQHIGELESRYAREKGLKIKLVAQARKINNRIVAFVSPQFVGPTSKLFYTNYEFNGLLVESFFADTQFIEGKGAGAFPTASAVLSDLSALTYDYRYEYKKVKSAGDLKLSNEALAEIFVRYSPNKKPTETDFESISERYERGDERYFIGTIALETLINASWLNDVSVVFVENGISELEKSVGPAAQSAKLKSVA